MLSTIIGGVLAVLISLWIVQVIAALLLFSVGLKVRQYVQRKYRKIGRRATDHLSI